MGSLSDPKSSRTPLKRKSTKSDLQTNLKISSDLMVKAQERNSESKREPLWKQQSISKRGVEMRDLPQASKGSNASISNKKNTSESNLIKNSNTKTKIKPKDSIDNIKTKGAEKRNSNIILDHVSGTRQDAVKAGLKPYYSQKNKFGKVPNYLKKRKQDLQNHAREVEAAKTSGHNSNDIQQLGEEERHSLIVGLKAKWEATMKQYQSLSVIVDTVSKKRRKLDLEKQLDELESDHQLLTKSPIIFVV